MFHGNVSVEIAKGLKVLRDRIDDSNIPSSKLDETLNVATWNIRAFGKKRRTNAAIHYIAEILSQFDLISVVELQNNLEDLSRTLKILGPQWRAVFSDVIPDSAGNRERIAFVYDRRAVVFNGLAAEANPPRTKRGKEYVSEFQWWRSPYMASFRTGGFDFVILTVHIQWGTTKGRTKELEKLAEWIEAKQREKHREDVDWFVTGDFNITSDAMLQIITNKGLQIPNALRQRYFGTNLAKKKRYDQILHFSIYPESFMNKGGILDFFDGDFGPLFPGKKHHACTYELSDHLPLWVQISTDIEGHRLDQIIQG